ncbi:TOBE domain-containing protein [Vibrio sp. 10N.261.55.A7]|uniref:TOBE domain-containing protein n=1 Tax=Vibrio sp. 10N.261.55.A7 TaxID=1880851 RepID=UPI000C848CE2|nr:TOBE domain-containing protein [Vibrio sp. 10N.261.55.A7]PMJ99117.1 molybdenum-dependent transcriptional regulator [Vibrio sp. 10N.261.55.A7]
MDLNALLTLSKDSKTFANPRRIALLEQIAVTGSISQGAKESGISYKAAWDAIKEMNQMLNQEVVTREKGGKGGGGAHLTPFGQRLLQVYSLTTQVQNMALTALLDETIQMDNLMSLMAHFSLKTSARNQINGQVASIQLEGAMNKIGVSIGDDQIIYVAITQISSQNLNLSLGKAVLLLFKAPTVSICTNPSKTCSTNQLAGQLTNISKNDTHIELSLALKNQQVIYSVMPLSEVENDFVLTNDYYACFDASQTIIACMDE